VPRLVAPASALGCPRVNSNVSCLQRPTTLPGATRRWTVAASTFACTSLGEDPSFARYTPSDA